MVTQMDLELHPGLRRGSPELRELIRQGRKAQPFNPRQRKAWVRCRLRFNLQPITNHKTLGISEVYGKETGIAARSIRCMSPANYS